MFKWKCSQSRQIVCDMANGGESESERGKWREMPNSHDLFHFNITQKWLNMRANNNLHWRSPIHHSQLKSLNISHSLALSHTGKSLILDTLIRQVSSCYANITKTNDLFNKRLLLYRNVYTRIIIYHSRVAHTHTHTHISYMRLKQIRWHRQQYSGGGSSSTDIAGAGGIACQTGPAIRNSIRWIYALNQCFIKTLPFHWLRLLTHTKKKMQKGDKLLIVWSLITFCRNGLRWIWGDHKKPHITKNGLLFQLFTKRNRETKSHLNITNYRHLLIRQCIEWYGLGIMLFYQI